VYQAPTLVVLLCLVNIAGLCCAVAVEKLRGVDGSALLLGVYV
jgi:hypothetical protein